MMRRRGIGVVAAIGIVALLVLIVSTMIEARNRREQEADRLQQVQRDLLQSKGEVNRLASDVDNLRLQVRGVQLLYKDAAKYLTCGGHDVSEDGRLEMFTWRNPETGQLCAHWCMHRKVGDDNCQEIGPDRCIP